jgi:hypothetical protein
LPRFYFHVFDDAVLLDDEGMELADSDAACREAVAGIRAMICDQVAKGRLPLSHRVEVADEAGRAVFNMTFGEAIRIER